MYSPILALLFADVFENFRNMGIKVYELDPAHFLSAPGLASQAHLKKTEIELELTTDFNMLLMVEQGIRVGICHAIHRYFEVNNKYIKNHDKSEEFSFLEYLDANNVYSWEYMSHMSICLIYVSVSQPLPVKNLSKIDEDFINNYDEDSDKGYIFDADIEYPRELHDLHSDLQFLPERMKVNKCNKLVCNLYSKNDYVIHIRSLKQALNHGLILKKFHRVIQFNQEPLFKPYIDMNTELKKTSKK